MKPFKAIALAALLSLSAGIYAADKFVTKRDTSIHSGYKKIITKSVLFSNSVPAYLSINEQVDLILEKNGCFDFSTATEEFPYHYEAFARIVGLNKYYVGIEVKINLDCDEPHHPLEGYFHLTFDSENGELLDMDSEIPRQIYNPEIPDDIILYQKELATLIYDEMKNNGTLRNSCYADVSREQAISFITFDYPEISGLARRKEVVIKTSPTLDNQECREILRMNYEKVRQYIREDSKMHVWLN